jgi:DNA-binding MarR family transcriptional regulator
MFPPSCPPPVDDRVAAVEAVRALARASSVLERVSGEVSLAHYRVLSAIASGDERASHIARKLAVGKPTVSAAVESLCQRDLLVRTSVAGDQRAAALHLTEAGTALLQRVETGMIARLEELCARTPDAAALIQALTWLGAALDSRLASRLGDGQGIMGKDAATSPAAVAAARRAGAAGQANAAAGLSGPPSGARRAGVAGRARS